MFHSNFNVVLLYALRFQKSSLSRHGVHCKSRGEEQNITLALTSLTQLPWLHGENLASPLHGLRPSHDIPDVTLRHMFIKLNID